MADDQPAAGAADSGSISLLALAERLQAAMLARHLTLATAESCTGGLVGHLLTEIAGASDYYRGGAVTYSDDAKREVLGVSEHVLSDHGSVSAQVCVAMADGARARFGAAVAVAVTGIAGPTGGSAAKPVGLTYVAVADEKRHDVRRFNWNGDRHGNKIDSARASLELVLEFIGA